MPKLAEKSFTDLYLKTLEAVTASAGTISTQHSAAWDSRRTVWAQDLVRHAAREYTI